MPVAPEGAMDTVWEGALFGLLWLGPPPGELCAGRHNFAQRASKCNEGLTRDAVAPEEEGRVRVARAEGERLNGRQIARVRRVAPTRELGRLVVGAQVEAR